MDFSIVKLNSLSYNSTQFYSVRFADKDKTEFKDLYERMKINSANLKEFSEIIDWMADWADYEGALPEYFKIEKDADRLLQPVELTNKDDGRGQDNFGLRWYCYRKNENIVILFNGDRKTKRTAQHCENVKDYFEQAVKLSKELDKAFNSGKLYIEGEFDLKTKYGLTLKID